MKAKLRVLLIDDDSDEAELLGDACQLFSQHVVFKSFTDGHEALKYIDEGNLPDFVFLDLNMPRISGKEVLGKLREREKTMNIRVVIYSTTITEQDRDDTRDLGVAHYLQKPENFVALQNSVRSILSGTPSLN
jgi:DNA-binding response OmpR family regulator